MNPKKIDRKEKILPSGKTKDVKVNGWYIAGLFNTDGGFSLHFVKNKESKYPPVIPHPSNPFFNTT